MNTRHINTRLFLLPLFAILLSAGAAMAQGFIKQYPFFTWSEGGGQSLFPQSDSSFRMTALSYPDFGTDIQLIWLDADAQGNYVQESSLYTPNSGSPVYGNDIFLLENGGYYRAYTDSNRLEIKRFDADGTLQWSQTHLVADTKRIALINAIANPAEELFIRGFSFNKDTNNIDLTGYVLKFSPNGVLFWEASYPFAWTYVIPSSFIPTEDGGCLFNNWASQIPGNFSGENLLRYDGDGNLKWGYSPANGRLWPHFDGKTFDVNSQDQTWLFMKSNPEPALPDLLHLEKLGTDGTLLNSVDLEPLLETVLYVEGELLFTTADGGVVVVVSENAQNNWTSQIAKIESDGSLAWKRPLAFFATTQEIKFIDGKELPDGSLLVYAHQGGELYLIKLGADGNIYPHTLNGQIVRDSTFNCVVDSFDAPLKDWIVQATGNGLTQYGKSGADGQYSIRDINNGDYEVILTPPSYLWEPCLDTVQLTYNSSIPLTDTLDFPVQSLYDCPIMEVDIATPFLRRCFQNIYAVKYCNTGNQPAEQVRITVLLDPLLTVDSAAFAFTQNGQELTFELGNVAAGECGSFKIYTTASCDAEMGQTLCVEAHIFPDTICAMNIPNWSGAQIEVSTSCAGDSVLFQIKNTGSADMQNALDFIIVDDHVITRQGMFQLPEGGIHEEAVPADGSTWRLIAEQEPGFPFGPQPPSVGVEACQANPQVLFTMGMLNMFPNYTGNPFHDIDCHAVIGSWDPNDKQALPIGVDAPHFIDQNQPIEYLIRFQNTGTDTAFTVVVRDTLSPWLDPASIRLGAASQPYTWELSGRGILAVTFANIMLPDSNVNEPASHGFVQFKINQRRDNPLGVIIENEAAIYFDFNEPVITNTVFHTVGKDYLLTATHQRFPDLLQLRIWPNPATQRSTVQLDDLNQPDRRLVLRDVSGRFVQEWPVQYLRQEIPRAGIPAGMYWLELREQGQLIAVGKLVWMD